MCFYDSERIRRKQAKYEKIRAYDLVHKLKDRGFSQSDSIDAINILLQDENTEFESSILISARSILESRKEAENDKQNFKGNGSNLTSDNGGSMRLTIDR